LLLEKFKNYYFILFSLLSKSLSNLRNQNYEYQNNTTDSAINMAWLRRHKIQFGKQTKVGRLSSTSFPNYDRRSQFDTDTCRSTYNMSRSGWTSSALKMEAISEMGLFHARPVMLRQKYSSPSRSVTNGSSQGLCPRIKWELSWIPLLEFHPPHPVSPRIRITNKRLLLFCNSFPLNLKLVGNCIIIYLTQSTLLFTAVTYEYIVSCGHGFITLPPPSPDISSYAILRRKTFSWELWG